MAVVGVVVMVMDLDATEDAAPALVETAGSVGVGVVDGNAAEAGMRVAVEVAVAAMAAAGRGGAGTGSGAEVGVAVDGLAEKVIPPAVAARIVLLAGAAVVLDEDEAVPVPAALLPADPAALMLAPRAFLVPSSAHRSLS